MTKTISVDIRELLAQFRAQDPTADLLTPDDIVKLEQIEALSHEHDGRRAAMAVHEYYGDMDRAQRTPRSMLYLHIGVLVGLVGRPARRR